MSSRFSIIVPVYNAERYVHDCINSIRVQSCVDFEAILVDDGSTDGTLRVLESFKSEDNRFQVYHQEHRGVSSARNVGINKAVGDFICFVDADDQIAPTYLADLYNAMGEADSSMCGFQKIDLLSHEDCIVVPEKKTETLEENLLDFYAVCSTDWQRYLWNRLFKKTIIYENNLIFKENIFYKEDGLFVVQYLCASNGLVGCIDKVLYYYYRNSTGSMSKTWHAFDEKIITNLEAHRIIIEEIKHKQVSNVVLLKALNQAKAASNWILQMMFETRNFSISLLMRTETIMLSILGIREYFIWRTKQIFK